MLPIKMQKNQDKATARIPKGHIVKNNSSAVWVATYLLMKSIKYTHSKTISPYKLNRKVSVRILLYKEELDLMKYLNHRKSHVGL